MSKEQPTREKILDAVFKLVYINGYNQEMSPVDADFEKAINCIYNRLRDKITLLLDNSQLKADVDKESLSEFIIATVWGSISLSPTQSNFKEIECL